MCELGRAALIRNQLGCAKPLVERAQGARLALPDRATDNNVLLAREVLRGMIALHEANVARELGDYAEARSPPAPGAGCRLTTLPATEYRLQDGGLPGHLCDRHSVPRLL